jgi:outer membrane receptor protein involved in Fe transport
MTLALVLGWAAGPTSGRAQPSDGRGAISGIVVDAANGGPLPGANVRLEGTSTGTSTDLNGRYRLGGLAPGVYDVVFSFVGFQKKVVSGVEVTDGATISLDATLAEQRAQLDQVVVSAKAARDTKAGLLKERAKAAAVSNAISAEMMGKAASSNAAEAMKKVTGVSVTEGKFVNVRGLGGRYVNAQLNGTELPSANPNTNAVPLDLFPAGLLDNIVTSKTFTPDQSGNFTGGNVNLSTTSFPDERTLSLSTSATYHSEVEFGKILRQGGGLEAIPGMIGPLPEGRVGAEDQPIPPYFGATQDEEQFLNEVTTAFAEGGLLTPRRGRSPINQSYSASYGDQFEVLGGVPLGIVTGLTYSKSASATQDRLSASAGPASEEGVTPDFRLTGESGATEETMGGMANVSIKPHPNHQISLNTLYNRSDRESSVFLTGRIPRDDDNRIFDRRRMEPIERTLWSVQGTGEHLLGSGGGSPRLTWNASYAKTVQDESDVRFFTDDRLPERDVHDISTAIYEAPTRYFRTLAEYTVSNDLSLSIPLENGTVTVGGSALYEKRDLDERRFSYGNIGAITYQGAPDIYFGECAGLVEPGECESGPYAGPSRSDLGAVIQERTANQNNLVGDRTVGAGFGMVDTDVPGIDPLRFVGGIRVEYTDQFVETRDSQTGQIEGTDILPSLNLVYSLREDMNLRAAYGRTIARPTFREFSPATYYDFKRQEIFDGNAGLDRTLVHNADLRWEWFPRAGELFAVSGYYKSFDAPIERVVVEQAINREVTYQNQQSARVYGAEMEARTRLGFIADPLRYMEVGGNVTVTESAVTDTSGTALGRPLEGQSPYLVNADLSYDHPGIGTTVSVSYNYFADRLDTIERANQPNQYERGRHTIDVVASQMLPYNVEVEISVENMLNAETEIYQEFESETFTTVRYRKGRTISVGITYNL